MCAYVCVYIYSALEIIKDTGKNLKALYSSPFSNQL